jgi:hypothetical protein
MTQLLPPYTYGEGYITMDAHIEGLPPMLQLDGVEYQVKDEFHCSLVATKKIVPQLIEREHLSQSEAEGKAVQVASKLINEIKPTITQIGPEVRLADQPERNRRTIVVMVEVDGLEEVFRRLNQELDINLPTQTTHITVYTMNGLPIGIPSREALEEYTSVISSDRIPALAGALEAVKEKL